MVAALARASNLVHSGAVQRTSWLAPSLSLFLLSACSSESPSSVPDAGPAAIARVIVSSEIRPGSNAQAACQISPREWLTIGNFGGPGTGPRPVDHGSAEGGGAVSVSCSVVAEGSDFRVSGSAALTGARGGTVTVSGRFAATPVPQPNVTMTFVNADLGRFEQRDCEATYDVAPKAGVAPGRIWMGVRCPRAVSTDNGVKTCETEAQIRFENCAQQ